MDPRQILADIDLAESKIHFSKSPIVLLCGGYVPEKEYADADEPPVRSLRDALKRKALSMMKAPHIFRPEEIKSWHEDGVYRNLMDFEADLASICSLIAIAVESEGAIAELGAFSQLPDFQKKLIVFVPEEYAGAKSFINLGILRHINETHGSGVKVYPWSPRYPHEIPEHVVIDAMDDIVEELEALKKTQHFSLSNNIHIIVLIYELVRLFVALKEGEIVDAIKGLGKDIHRDDVRRKIYLLQEFDFIKKIGYSDSTFYTCDDDSFHSLKFALKAGGMVDVLRLKMECIDYYKAASSERNRNRAIDRAKLGIAK
ncbi:retron St85 family effector protein [Pseudomonas machongensis]